MNFKHAFASMKVHEPLRLQSTELSFEPPNGEVPPCEVPQPVLPKENSAQCENPQIKSANNRIAQSEVTQTENAQEQLPQKKCDQKKKAEFENPQQELPQFEGHCGGFFKLSHGVFQDPVLRGLTGDAFRLFLFLSSRAWRFPDSKGTVRASVRFIEEELGMPHATVSRGLKTLKEAQLVSLVKVDFKKGNSWRVLPRAFSGGSKNNECPQTEVPENESQAGSNGGSYSLKTSKKPPQYECKIKKFNNKNKIKRSVPITFEVERRNEEISEDEVQTAKAAFNGSLTEDQQSKFLEGYVARAYPHGFCPPQRIIQNLAALAWVKETRQFTYMPASKCPMPI